MKLLIDAQLPPSLAPWIRDNFDFDSYSFDYLGWRTLEDEEAFLKAKKLGSTVIITKDNDFIQLLSYHQSPPKIIWITSGNTSNAALRALLEMQLKNALDLLDENDLVEIK